MYACPTSSSKHVQQAVAGSSTDNGTIIMESTQAGLLKETSPLIHVHGKRRPQNLFVSGRDFLLTSLIFWQINMEAMTNIWKKLIFTISNKSQI